jgi:hypothetical protein
MYVADPRLPLRPYKRDLARIARYVPPMCNAIGQDLDLLSGATNFVTLASYNRDDFLSILSQIAGFKNLANWPINELFLFLSLVTLEKHRAYGLGLGSFLEYYRSDYDEQHLLNIDLLFPLVFREFTRRIDRTKGDKSGRDAVKRLAIAVFSEFATKNPHLPPIQDQILGFLDKHSAFILDPDVLAPFAVAFQRASAARRPVLEEWGGRLFSSACSTSWDSFSALLADRFQQDWSLGITPPFMSLLGLLPPDFQDAMLSRIALELSAAASDAGLARALATAKAILRAGDERGFPALFSRDLDPEFLPVMWSQSLVFERTFQPLIARLVYEFLSDAQASQGMFRPHFFDLSRVSAHEAYLKFFTEQQSFNSSHSLLSAFSVLSRANFTDDPRAIVCFLYLALFAGQVLRSREYLQSVALHASLVFVRAVLEVIAMHASPMILSVITPPVTALMDSVLQVFPSIGDAARGCTGHISMANDALRERMALFHDRLQREAAVDLPRICEFLGSALAQHHAFYLLYLAQPTAPRCPRPQVPAFLELLPLLWRLSPGAVAALCPLLFGTDVLLHSQSSDRLAPVKVLLTGSWYAGASSRAAVRLISCISRSRLSLCRPVSAGQAMAFLNPDVLASPSTARFLFQSLQFLELDELLQNIPQLVQSLRDDNCRFLQRFLRKKARESPIFAHALLWNILYEKCQQSFPGDPLPNILVILEGRILGKFPPKDHLFYEHEFGLIDAFDRISQTLLQLPPEQRQQRLVEELGLIRLTSDLYVPSNPGYHIISIDAPGSRCLKSHARVPILVSFVVCDEEKRDEGTFTFGCIFKIHDDVRMDAMMIQFIDKFQRIFKDAGLETYMNPYRVFATGGSRGVIQCIQRAKSRHDLGIEKAEDLLALFQRRYGPVWSDSFAAAQHNFIISLAPYSLLCYIFQVKDRHNANIMFDDDGHVLHIDFGFIFDLAPGNIKFEKSSFRLSGEMVQLLGGSRDAPAFRKFTDLFCQCFIAARARYAEIESIAWLMRKAGLPCFRPDPFKKFEQRFFLDRVDTDLLPAIEGVISDAMNSITSLAYDAFQQRQNQIFYI